jgi:hypothetical protein
MTTNLEKKQIDLIRESICVYIECTKCTDLYKGGQLCFKNLEEFVDDRGKSCLFRLKEMCHELFRNSNDATDKETLYDMTVGYIFHAAMILRESLYQLEYYKPRSDMASNQFTTVERKIFREIDTLVRKTEKKLKEGFRETRNLLNQLMEQLKDLVRLYKDNYLLPRFVFENEKSLVRIYGKRGFADLLNDMYRDGRVLLMFKAAQSYLESEYYDTARKLFKRVALLDSGSKAALFFFMYCSAHHFYFKSRFSKAMSYGEKALAMGVDKNEAGPYLEPLQTLMADVLREVKGTRKLIGR